MVASWARLPRTLFTLWEAQSTERSSTTRILSWEQILPRKLVFRKLPKISKLSALGRDPISPVRGLRHTTWAELPTSTLRTKTMRWLRSSKVSTAVMNNSRSQIEQCRIQKWAITAIWAPIGRAATSWRQTCICQLIEPARKATCRFRTQPCKLFETDSNQMSPDLNLLKWSRSLAMTNPSKTRSSARRQQLPPAS